MSERSTEVTSIVGTITTADGITTSFHITPEAWGQSAGPDGTHAQLDATQPTVTAMFDAVTDHMADRIAY